MDQGGLASLASPSFPTQLKTVLSFKTNLKLDPVGSNVRCEVMKPRVHWVSIGQ